jgi:hypothetical protein
MEYNEVIEHYNNGQDEYIIEMIREIHDRYNKPTGEYIVILEQETCNHIGFYEWLFNPKYKVFEVFKIELNYIFSMSIGEGYIDELYGMDSVEKILTYLKNQIKEQ